MSDKCKTSDILDKVDKFVSNVKSNVDTILNSDLTRINSDVTKNTSDIKIINSDVTRINSDVKILESQEKEFNLHINTAQNFFSLDKINNVLGRYLKCINKINFALNLIEENKEEIKFKKNYANILRPIFEKKYTDSELTTDGYVFITDVKPSPTFVYFMEPIPSQDNTPNFIGNYANLENQRVEPENNFVIKLSELQKKNPSKKIFYIINYHKWNNGLKLSINIAIPDILKEGWIRIGAGINLLQDLPELNNITSINQIPEPFLEWNQTIEEVINNYSSISYNSSIGTIYEYGSIFMFPSLRVVRSSEYPSWNGKLIEDCYIPGSNIDYPKQIKQINTNLNSNYTGLKEGQITIVKYVVGDDYYTGIIQMIKIKEKLCYQLIGSINMNGIFNTSVKIIGDTINSGNLNVLNNNNESIVSTDNTRKITTIHDKLGINQEFHEVSGLLDIDNLTQQVIIDTNIAFSTYLLNSYNIINILIGNNKFSTVDDIQELFKIDKSLYSYGEQCYIYSSDIKPIIEPENITILYEPKTLYLNLKFEGFFKKLQNNVKIFNWILPEYNEAGDKDYIFSSCDLVYNEDIDWFLISTKSIIRDNKLISVTTFFDVTNLMKDNSYSTQLTKVLEYFSKQYMFLNYAVLLVKNPSIFKELENGNSYIFTDTIQKNPFLSNRFNLTETSKIFSLQIDGDQTYLINESDLGWCRQSAKNLYALQLNVGQVLDLEVSLLDKYFNKILNCTCNFVVTFLNDRRINRYWNRINRNFGSKFIN